MLVPWTGLEQRPANTRAVTACRVDFHQFPLGTSITSHQHHHHHHHHHRQHPPPHHIHITSTSTNSSTNSSACSRPPLDTAPCRTAHRRSKPRLEARQPAFANQRVPTCAITIKRRRRVRSGCNLPLPGTRAHVPRVSLLDNAPSDWLSSFARCPSQATAAWCRVHDLTRYLSTDMHVMSRRHSHN